MSRSSVTVRAAVPADAPTLVTLWEPLMRRCPVVDQIGDLEAIIASANLGGTLEVLVAEVDRSIAGAVLLREEPLNPLNPEPCLQIIAPQVFPEHQRRGIGKTLMDAAVARAEERGISYVSSAATAGAREGNRFLASFGFTSHVTLRVAPTQAVRSRLSPRQGSSLQRVLTARRTLRRAASVRAQ